MNGIRQKLRLLGAALVSATVVMANFLASNTASANPLNPRLFITQTPAAVTTSNTATVAFSSLGDPTECQVDSGSFDTCDSPYTTPVLDEGPHTLTVHVTDSTDPRGTKTVTWNSYIPPSLIGGNSVSGAANNPIAITSLQIAGASNDALPVRLNVASGTLHMTTTTGLTFTGGTSGSTLRFSGSRSNLNAALATLTYTSSNTGNKQITAYIDGTDGERYNTVDGRVFQVVYSGGMSWSDSKAAAEASTYGGAHGYLASITSSNQADFVTERITGGTWLGGSDTASEGDWRWTDGPEANTQFWSGDFTGAAFGGAYTNWAGGMPDNYNGNENCTETYPGTPLTWNDQDCSQLRDYYVVEYGDGVTIPFIDTLGVAVTVNLANNDTSLITHTTSSSGKAIGDLISRNYSNDGVSSADSDSPLKDTAAATSSRDTKNQATVVTTTPKAETNSKFKVVAYTSSFGALGLLVLILLFFWHKKRATAASTN